MIVTIYEFAAYIAKKTDTIIARRYGVTKVEVTGSQSAPMIHIVNKTFGIDQAVPVAGPYKDLKPIKRQRQTLMPKRWPLKWNMPCLMP